MLKKKPEISQTKLHVELLIHSNPKLEKLFPIDKNANVLVKCGSKEFKLKIAYLRPDSQYFEKLAEEGQSLAEFNPSDFGASGEASFEKIMFCLYGGKAIIETPDELFSAYIVCQILGIQKLIENLEETMNKNIKNLNFFTLFQFAVRFYIDSLLETCKNHLKETQFACLKDSSIPKNQSISRNTVVPAQFLDLDTSATIAILKINKELQNLSALDLFSLIKAKANQDVRLFAQLSQMFIPADKLSSSDFSYIQKCMTDQEYAMYSSSSMSQRENSFQESRIYELESENVYFQKKNKELEQQNEQLKNEMIRMKEEINLKTDEFTTNYANLNNKLTSLQKALTTFEDSEAVNKSEYYEKNKEMSQLIQQQTIKIGEQMHQIQNLLSVINNFKNESPPSSSLYPTKTENTQNIKPQTTQGFYRAQTQDNNQDNLMMTVQSYQLAGEAGGKMAYSNAVPLFSNLVTANQSLFYNLPAAQKKQVEASKGMKLQCQQYEQPGGEEETKTNEMQSLNNHKNDFITFEDNVTSNVLDASKVDYETLFDYYFQIIQFKKLKLKLLYRSTDHGFSRKQFRKQVIGAGETLILIKSWERKSAQYFGGYLSVPWQKQEPDAAGRFTRDDNAFLFSISQKCKMPIKNPEYALFEKDGLIFSFGRKDLCIAEKGEEELVNSSIVPQDYQASKQNQNSNGCVIAGSTSFLVDILEVFLIQKEEEMDF